MNDSPGIKELSEQNDELKKWIDALERNEYKQEDRIAELEQWCKAAQIVIALGVELMPLDQLSQWTAVRTVQESCPVEDDE